MLRRKMEIIGENRERNRYRFEKTGPDRYIDNRRIKPEYCHAFINNISFWVSIRNLKKIDGSRMEMELKPCWPEERKVRWRE